MIFNALDLGDKGFLEPADLLPVSQDSKEICKLAHEVLKKFDNMIRVALKKGDFGQTQSNM